MIRLDLRARVLLAVGSLFSLLTIVLMFNQDNIVLAIDDPDTLTIESIQIFRNYEETGDQVWVIEYKIEYETNPTEDPRAAFYVGIGDGVSILFNTPVNSYGHSFASIYLDSNNALTWEGTYFIHVSGVLGVFPTLSIGVNQQLLAVDSSDWDGSATSEDTRTALGQHILSVVEAIEINTGVTYLTDLRKLNTAGSTLVRANVYKATNYLTDIFTIVLDPFIEPSPTYFQNYQATLEGRRGERLTNSLDTLGIMITGKSDQGQVIGTIGFLLIAITILGTIYATTQDSTSSLIIVLPLAYVGNTMGILSLPLMFTVFLFVAFLFAITFILSRVG